MRMLFTSLGLMVLLSLTACATGNANLSLEEKLAKREYSQGKEVDEVSNYRVDGWNYLDEKHVILNAGPSRNYLISLTIRCTDLRSAEAIGFTSTNTRLTRFDKIVVGTETGERSCSIDRIYQLDKME